MLIEVRLHDLAQHIRNLLGLESARVSLVLECPEPALRHPLLDMFDLHPDRSAPCYGSLIDGSLLSNERLWALCDIAMQTGRYNSYAPLSAEASTAGSIAIAPLERPAGVLGFLLFVDNQPDALCDGERLLIEQYLPTIARCVEETLFDACIPVAREIRERDVVIDMQEQSEFLSLVGHELRVPLTAIKGYAGLLQAYNLAEQQLEGGSAVMTAARQQQYLDVIVEQANHLEVLIGDLLDLSRLQAGRLSLRPMWVNVAYLCQRATQLIQQRADQQEPGRYCIRCHIGSRLPSAWADPDRVRQVLTNLLENAVKYSPSGGIIEIETYAAPSRMIAVTVRDQGIGIPQELQGTLFQPYTRLAHTATARVSGTGLGLYIARKLVEAMGGRVILQSREGQGTSITFTLPVRAPEIMQPVYECCERESI
jgi:signal transduction histidine kinase